MQTYRSGTQYGQPSSPTVARRPWKPRASVSRARSSAINLSARRTWGEPLIATSAIADQRTIRAQRRAPSGFFGRSWFRGALIGRSQGFGQVMTGPSVLVHGLRVGDLRERPPMLPAFIDLRDPAQDPPGDDHDDERGGRERPPHEIFADWPADVPARAILSQERKPLPVLGELADELVEIHGAIFSADSFSGL